MADFTTVSNLSNASSIGGRGQSFGVVPIALRVSYGIIGVLSILCNGLLCMVVLRRPRMRRTSYNLLVVTLAITDTITGVIIAVSPSFVVGNEFMPIPSGVGGEIFCRLVQNNFFVWLLAKVSVFIVMTMTIERWYAIARPHQYREVFKRETVRKYVALVFVFNFVVISPQLFKIHLETKGTDTTCIYNSLGGVKMASQIYVISYCMVTVFIPFAIICATYFHLRYVVTVQRHPPHTLAQIQRRRMEMTLLRMTAAVALCLAICFTPNQITYILMSFGIVHLVVIRVAAVLSMLNSVINNWVYCLTNKSYRAEFVRLLFPKRKRNFFPKYLYQIETTTSGCHEMAYL